MQPWEKIPHAKLLTLTATAVTLCLPLPGSTHAPTARAASPAQTLQAAAQGHTYYVAPNGSDRNPCTRAAPCADLIPFWGGGPGTHPHPLQPGDQVIYQPGTYDMSATAPQSVIYAEYAYGTPSAPITITASGPVTLVRALGSNGRLTDAQQTVPLVDLSNAAYLTLTGPFTVVGAKNQPGYNHADKPYGGEVQIENHGGTTPAQQYGRGITVSGLTVRDANNTCIKEQDGEQRTRIVNNTLINCGQPGSGYVDHGVYVTGPDNTIQGNKVVSAVGFGIQAYGPVAGTQILSNTIYGTVNGSGIITDDAARNTIAGNVVYDNPHGGLDVRWHWTATASDPITITRNLLVANGQPNNAGIHNLNLTGPGTAILTNNTFYKTVSATEIGIPLGPITLTIENNIFYGADPVSGTTYTAPWRSIANVDLSGNVVDYNDYYDVRPIYNCRASYRTGCNNPSYDGGHSLPYGTGMSSYRGTDPLFVGGTVVPVPGGPSIPDLHLRPGSPAIGAGTPLAGSMIRPTIGALP